MATKRRKRRTKQSSDPRKQPRRGLFCLQPQTRAAELPAGLSPHRERLILQNRTKWTNGTVLHYYFFDRASDGRDVTLVNGTVERRPWKGPKREQDVVRSAFTTWKDVGIGVEFREVDSREEAEIRIAFERGDGAWSYIGRDVLEQGTDDRTMNFGWDVSQDIDTPIHEIGHTIGFPHEHQNPNAGIVWDDEVVYAALAAPPNNWSREDTFWNIIRKLPRNEVRGSQWDPDSIMHYPFEPGLIKEPATYYRDGLTPAGGLSDWDKTYARTFYPPLRESDYAELAPSAAVKLQIGPGEQRHFRFSPPATRKYDVGTFGTSDSVVVLFEEVDGALRYLAGDDDSGEDRNAHLQEKLYKGRRYVVRVRLYYAEQSGETAVMLW